MSSQAWPGANRRHSSPSWTPPGDTPGLATFPGSPAGTNAVGLKCNQTACSRIQMFLIELRCPVFIPFSPIMHIHCFLDQKTTNAPGTHAEKTPPKSCTKCLFAPCTSPRAPHLSNSVCCPHPPRAQAKSPVWGC